MKFSYSRVETYKKCPHQYCLRYVKRLTTIPDQEATNALYLGTALHAGMEHDVEEAIRTYYSNYYVITDTNVNEAIKLEVLITKMKEVVPDGIHEAKLDDEDYVGFIDLLVPVDENTYDMYDFKYSNNVANYLESGQLSVYKWKFEQLNPGKTIRKLYFVFAPKLFIRQKKTETLEQFRNRLRDELEKGRVRIVEIPFSQDKVDEYESTVEEIKHAETFPKNPTRLCDWCEFKNYCKNGEMWEIYPKD